LNSIKEVKRLPIISTNLTQERKSQVGYQNRVEKVRITAEKVAHVFDKKRPGQIRGVTFLHPVMIRLRDLDIFQDASLRKQQISACFSAFIYNSTGDTLDNTYSNKIRMGAS
jgi:capsid protein